MNRMNRTLPQLDFEFRGNDGNVWMLNHGEYDQLTLLSIRRVSLQSLMFLGPSAVRRPWCHRGVFKSGQSGQLSKHVKTSCQIADVGCCFELAVSQSPLAVVSIVFGTLDPTWASNCTKLLGVEGTDIIEVSGWISPWLSIER